MLVCGIGIRDIATNNIKDLAVIEKNSTFALLKYFFYYL